MSQTCNDCADFGPDTRCADPARAGGAGNACAASHIARAGRKRGPITRLMSPSDLGEMLKPFVFLDHAEVPYTRRRARGHPPALRHRDADDGVAGRSQVRGHDRQDAAKCRRAASSG